MNNSGSTTKQLIFYIALALLASHELDAVARHEWRLLPILSQLSEPLARDVFILSHIPLFAIIFWLTSHPRAALRQRSQLILALFMIAHGIIHFALSGHHLYEFEAPVETITVYGAAVASLLWLWLGRNQKPTGT